jgi:hypothetical protein
MTILGYGRYGDDPEHVGCPRAKSDMTPCIARDGHLALADDRACVGCYAVPGQLLAQLEQGLMTRAPALAAAAGGRELDDHDRQADLLTQWVRELTAP